MKQTNQNQLVRGSETEWKSLSEIHEDDVTGVYVKSLMFDEETKRSPTILLKFEAGRVIRCIIIRRAKKSLFSKATFISAKTIFLRAIIFSPRRTICTPSARITAASYYLKQNKKSKLLKNELNLKFMKKPSFSEILLVLMFTVLYPLSGIAQQKSDALPKTQKEIVAERDGQKDFDFEIGTWKTRLKRLQNPLSGSTTWIEYEGTTVVRKVWDGRANLVELDVKGAAGRIEALSLRLYNPQSRQWSLNFASVNGGALSPPTVGGFKDGRGEFYNQETFNGRAILVRFIISDITADSCRFEQAFSDDGGKTWETNWIANDTRIKNAQKEI